MKLYKVNINRENLINLSEEEKIELILSQHKEIERLKKEIEELKIKNRVKRTSINSSIPPSKDMKGNKDSIDYRRENSHKLGGRELSVRADKEIKILEVECKKCNNKDIENKLISSYDKIVYPKVRIETVRVNVYESKCKRCNEVLEVEIPVDLRGRDLLSDEIKSEILYLHYDNYLSYERIVKYFKDIYGIEISEGLIDNVIKSIKDIIKEKAEEIRDKISNSELICSDETSVRVKGKTNWQWVFLNDEYVYHIISETRGSIVKRGLFVDKHPNKYVSDGYSSQKLGVKNWQICLAHQIRDCNYVIETEKSEFAMRMKELFEDAIKEKDKDISTKKIKKKEFLKRLDDILMIVTNTNSENKLKKRFEKVKNNLFMFLDYDDVPPTNNCSEQALRNSVIFRKVTNGFRSQEGKDIFANYRTVIDTGKKQGKKILDSILEIFKEIKKIKSYSSITKNYLCQYG